MYAQNKSNNNNNKCDFSSCVLIPLRLVEHIERGIHFLHKESLTHLPHNSNFTGAGEWSGELINWESPSLEIYRPSALTQTPVPDVSLTPLWVYTFSNPTPAHPLLIMNFNAHIFVSTFIFFKESLKNNL